MNSDVLRLIPAANSFQYQLLPSAFKIAESPTYLCWKAIKFSESLWNRNSADNWEQFKNRTLAIIVGTSGYLGGMVALPITICLTPITLLADIVVGATECVFCFYKGLEKEDISIIAHRKFIISPCQHLTFCLGAITGLGVAWFLVSGYTINPWIGFKASLVIWSMGYAFGQVAVGLLPKNLNHQSLNIFIGGGSGEGVDEQEKWLDSNISTSNEPKSNTSFGVGNYYAEWEDFIRKEISSLNRIDDANLAIQYVNFKQRLLNRCNPKDLLELSNNFNQVDLQRKYRALALIIHPDKNQPRQREATAVFAVLQKAYELLSQQ